MFEETLWEKRGDIFPTWRDQEGCLPDHLCVDEEISMPGAGVGWLRYFRSAPPGSWGFSKHGKDSRSERILQSGWLNFEWIT